MFYLVIFITGPIIFLMVIFKFIGYKISLRNVLALSCFFLGPTLWGLTEKIIFIPIFWTLFFIVQKNLNIKKSSSSGTGAGMGGGHGGV